MSAPPYQITVVTPCFNSAEYLEQTILSVARQTGVSVEHIVIDDASTDDSVAVLERLAAQCPNLRVIKLDQNIGQARARNHGLDRASGDYIAFLDSDDHYVADDALARWHAAAANGADMVRADYLRFKDGDAELAPATNSFDGVRKDGVDIETYPELVNNTSCWLFLYRREFLDRHNVRFSERLKQREDRPFFLLALLHARVVNLIPDRLIAYRIRPDSTMRRVTWEQLGLFAIHLRLVSEYMTGLAASDARRAFRRANLLYCVQNLIDYWGVLLRAPDALQHPEAIALYEAARLLHWDIDDLGADRVLTAGSATSEDAREKAVVAHVILRAGDGAAFGELLRTGRLPLACLQRLALGYLGDGGAAADRRALDTLYEFARRHPPLPESFAVSDDATDLPPIVLHCGTTKTGSSSLQTFFEQNRFELLQRYGVYYPYTGLERGSGSREHRTSGHAGLVQSLMNKRKDALLTLRRELHSLDKLPRVVFLSAENILSDRFWQGGECARLLAAMLEGHSVKIVAYLRRQEDWLESMYVESVTSPGIRLVSSPMDYAAAQRQAGLLDPVAVDAALRSAFPPEAIIYRSYELARAAGDTIDDFLPLVGIEDRAPGVPRPSGRVRNESTPKLAALLIRELNRISMERANVVEANAAITAATTAWEQQCENRPAYGFYSEGDRRAIASIYDLGNRAFYLQYFGQVPDFVPRPDLVPVLEQGMLPVQLVGTLMDALTRSSRGAGGAKGAGKGKAAKAGRLNGKAALPVISAIAPELPSYLADGSLWAYSRRPLTRLLMRFDPALRALLRTAHMLDASRRFDREHYLSQAPDAKDYPGGPIVHYLRFGRQRGLNPAKGFSGASYLLHNPDVADSGIDPFLHFLKHGEREGRTVQ